MSTGRKVIDAFTAIIYEIVNKPGTYPDEMLLNYSSNLIDSVLNELKNSNSNQSNQNYNHIAAHQNQNNVQTGSNQQQSNVQFTPPGGDNFCKFILVGGPRKGQPCGVKCKKGEAFCKPQHGGSTQGSNVLTNGSPSFNFTAASQNVTSGVYVPPTSSGSSLPSYIASSQFVQNGNNNGYTPNNNSYNPNNNSYNPNNNPGANYNQNNNQGSNYNQNNTNGYGQNYNNNNQGEKFVKRIFEGRTILFTNEQIGSQMCYEQTQSGIYFFGILRDENFYKMFPEYLPNNFYEYIINAQLSNDQYGWCQNNGIHFK